MLRNFTAKACYLIGNKLSGEYNVVVPTCCNGIKMFVDFNDGIDKSIFNHGFCDRGLTDYIIKNIKHDDVCVDVGANIGWFSCLLGFFANLVYSFECNSIVFNRLACNVYLNNLCDKVVLSSNALGSFNGKSDFVSYTHSGHRHLGNDVRFRNNYTGISKVNVRRLDDYLCDIEHFDFLKIDVEGYEFDVIKGGSHLIEKFKPAIVFE